MLWIHCSAAKLALTTADARAHGDLGIQHDPKVTHRQSFRRNCRDSSSLLTGENAEPSETCSTIDDVIVTIEERPWSTSGSIVIPEPIRSKTLRHRGTDSPTILVSVTDLIQNIFVRRRTALTLYRFKCATWDTLDKFLIDIRYTKRYQP